MLIVIASNSALEESFEKIQMIFWVESQKTFEKYIFEIHVADPGLETTLDKLLVKTLM